MINRVRKREQKRYSAKCLHNDMAVVVKNVDVLLVEHFMHQEPLVIDDGAASCGGLASSLRFFIAIVVTPISGRAPGLRAQLRLRAEHQNRTPMPTTTNAASIMVPSSRRVM